MKKIITRTVIALWVVIGLVACGGGGGGSDPSTTPTTLHTLSGTIAESSGVAMPGVTVLLTGPIAGITTTTDNNGNYSFSNLASGDYIITPSKAGYTCSPPSQTVRLSNADSTGINFVGSDVVSPPPVLPTLTYISITPINPGINVGTTLQFTITGTYSDQTTKDLSLSAIWASSNTNIATVSSTGLAFGKAAGSTVIVATYGGTTVSTILTVADIDPLLAYTQILRGKWHFVFTIISTFTEDFSLSTIDGSKNSQGGYYIDGTDQFGAFVNATYWPVDGDWTLLDQRNIIDMFFVFYTDGSTILNGSCYYQITVATGEWSPCFPLSGYKTSSIPAPSLANQNGTNIQTAAQLMLENTTFTIIDSETKAKYSQLKDMNSSSLK